MTSADHLYVPINGPGIFTICGHPGCKLVKEQHPLPAILKEETTDTEKLDVTAIQERADKAKSGERL